jgi:ribosomal-protein-alanine N-acetyltransferase
MNALLRPRFSMRPITPRDLDAVLRIEVGAYSFPWNRGNFIDSLASGYLAELMLAPDGAPIGYFVALPGVDELHLLNITVAPAMQGRGHGQKLLDVVEARCREQAALCLWLEVRASNMRARALYARRGFAEVGLRRGYYPAPMARREDAIVMRLEVAGRS